MEKGITPEEIRQTVNDLMPEVTQDLAELIRHPSVSFPGYPSEPVYAAADATLALLKRCGLSSARFLDIPGGYSSIYGEIPAPPGKPTLLLYAHYDVQPAKKEDGWEIDPWDPAIKNGRIFGRGSADDKSGIAIIAASLKVFGGKPPVGIKVLIEGEEETNGHLEEFVAANPEVVQCDAFLILDNGNIAEGEPALTVSTRGETSCIVEVETLDHSVHSGMFGGVAPDALIVLSRIIATLHDADGNVAVPGLHVSPREQNGYDEAMFRDNAGVLEGVDLIGTGPVGSRLWSRPSVTVIGIDAPAIRGSSNILIPRAAAKVSLRIAPDADPKRELGILMDYLNKAAPWHAKVTVTESSKSPGFVCPEGGPVYSAAKVALYGAYGNSVLVKGTGGSIPLLQALQDVVPKAEFILWGADDAASSRIHGTNESVSIGELERMIVAQCLLFRALGEPAITENRS